MVDTFAFWRVIGRTVSATARFLLVFLGVAVVAYAAAKAMIQVRGGLFPVTGGQTFLSAPNPLLDGFLRVIAGHFLTAPALVIETFAAGVISHRAFARWQGHAPSLSADALAAARAFWSLAAIALIWLVLTLLPWLPDWFRAPPSSSPHLRPEVLEVFVYYYVYWHPFVSIGMVALLALGMWWCLAVPAAVLEGLGPFAALKRSMELTKGRYFKIFVLWLIYAASSALLVWAYARLQPWSAAQSWKPLEWLDAVRWMLAVIVMAVGITAIYFEARLTTQADATEPEPTAPQ